MPSVPFDAIDPIEVGLAARVRAWADQAVEPIDAAAIARSATKSVPVAQRVSWLPPVRGLAGRGSPTRARAIRFVVAGAIVALFAGVLLNDALIIRRSDEPLPGVAPAASPTATMIDGVRIETHRYQSTSFPGAGPLPLGPAPFVHGDRRYEIIRDSSPFSFEVPSDGWVSDGLSVITREADGASVRFWLATPDGIHTDPCSGGPARALSGDFVNPVEVMATIPDTILESGPSEVMVGGILADQFVLTVPEDGSCARGFKLWSDEGPDGRPEPRPGDTIGVWIVPQLDCCGRYLWIEARTPQGTGPGIDAETAQIVASATAPGDPFFPHAGPVEGEQESSDAVYEDAIHHWFAFTVPEDRGWLSTGFDDVGNGGGSLVRGEIGTPDGAVITFSWRPDHVYADPCAHTLMDPPPGPSPSDFAAALAGIPGVDVLSGPTDTEIGEAYGKAKSGPRPGPGLSAIELVLKIREDIDCEPQDFYLWADECTDARRTAHEQAYEHRDRLCLERPDPRPARALGSTITLWVLDAPLFLVDAETYAGAPPDVEREILQIIDSIECCGAAG
jgi:hypothetical protein